MKKIISAILLMTTFTFVAEAQSLSRQVISSVGTYTETMDLSLSATAGEVAYTSSITGTLTLLQGFQQPEGFIVSSNEELFAVAMTYKVYPNPATDRLTVELKTASFVEINLFLSDLSGRKIEGFDREVKGKGSLKEVLPLSGLPVGAYLLSFKDSKGSIIETRKISKAGN